MANNISEEIILDIKNQIENLNPKSTTETKLFSILSEIDSLLIYNNVDVTDILKSLEKVMMAPQKNGLLVYQIMLSDCLKQEKLIPFGLLYFDNLYIQMEKGLENVTFINDNDSDSIAYYIPKEKQVAFNYSMIKKYYDKDPVYSNLNSLFVVRHEINHALQYKMSANSLNLFDQAFILTTQIIDLIVENLGRDYYDKNHDEFLLEYHADLFATIDTIKAFNSYLNYGNENQMKDFVDSKLKKIRDKKKSNENISFKNKFYKETLNKLLESGIPRDKLYKFHDLILKEDLIYKEIENDYEGKMEVFQKSQIFTSYKDKFSNKNILNFTMYFNPNNIKCYDNIFDSKYLLTKEKEIKTIKNKVEPIDKIINMYKQINLYNINRSKLILSEKETLLINFLTHYQKKFDYKKIDSFIKDCKDIIKETELFDELYTKLSLNNRKIKKEVQTKVLKNFKFQRFLRYFQNISEDLKTNHNYNLKLQNVDYIKEYKEKIDETKKRR